MISHRSFAKIPFALMRKKKKITFLLVKPLTHFGRCRTSKTNRSVPSSSVQRRNGTLVPTCRTVPIFTVVLFLYPHRSDAFGWNASHQRLTGGDWGSAKVPRTIKTRPKRESRNASARTTTDTTVVNLHQQASLARSAQWASEMTKPGPFFRR